jgi:hypothetical protein
MGPLLTPETFYTVIITCIMPRSIVAPARNKEADKMDLSFTVSVKGEHTLADLKNNYYNNVSLLGINPEEFKFYKNSAFIISADDAAAIRAHGVELHDSTDERTVIISAIDLTTVFALLFAYGENAYTANLVSRHTSEDDIILIGSGGIIVDKVIGFQRKF